MPYLGRQVSPERWEPSPGLDKHEVSAEMLTSGKELKALGNTLSFYESAISAADAVQRTALATAATFDQLDPVHIAWLDRGALEGDDVLLESTEGKTTVKDLRNDHREAVRLDGFRLARIAARLASAVRGSEINTLNREAVRKLLQDAVDSRRVGYTELKVGLRKELRPPDQ